MYVPDLFVYIIRQFDKVLGRAIALCDDCHKLYILCKNTKHVFYSELISQDYDW